MFGEVKQKLVSFFSNRSSVFCLFILVFSFFLIKIILIDKGVGHPSLISLFMVAVETAIYFLWRRLDRKKAPLEKKFLALAIPLGLMFLIVLPPGQTPDDLIHFARAYDITNGALIASTPTDEYEGAVGGDVPVETLQVRVQPAKDSYERILGSFTENSGETRKQTYTAAAIYNFLCYIPQTIAIMIGRAFSAPLYVILYLVEMVNFVFWLVLIYYSIKLIPGKKLCVMFIALFPITLQEATSISPDAMTIALSIFLVSYVFYLIYGLKGKIQKRNMVVLSLVAILIGFCKLVYLPLLLLYLMIPYEKYGTKKKKWYFTIGLLIFVGIINLVWLIVSSRYLVEIRDGVNSGAQLAGIISGPFSYLLVIVRTIGMQAGFYTEGIYGSSLGAFVINLPSIIMYLYLIVTVCLFMQCDDSRMRLDVKQKYYLLFVLAIIVGLIFTSLYLQWTPYKGLMVDGVQGRYFIPILILIPMIVASSRKGTHLISEKSVVSYSVFAGAVAIITCFAMNI